MQSFLCYNKKVKIEDEGRQSYYNDFVAIINL